MTWRPYSRTSQTRPTRRAPVFFVAKAGTTEATLLWTWVPDATGWEYQQDGGAWTAISGSNENTTSHTVTGLTNGTAYSFKVRAYVGTGDTRVNGVESDAKSAATPS